VTPKRTFIRLLDRSGGRRILAFLATRYVRRKTGLDVEVFYDGAWIRRVNRYYLAESLTLDWNVSHIETWRPDLREVFDLSRDWWLFGYQPRNGDVVLDIGAGIGEGALMFSQMVGARGRVLAVEAHPTTFGLLQKTCRLNRIEDICRCIPFAIMDKAGAISLENREAWQENTAHVLDDETHVGQTVKACSLDDLCAQNGVSRIDFLKMNIEGAERYAIKGMQGMIRQTQAVCIACHDFRSDAHTYRTKALVAEFLQANGFEIRLREQHPDPWVRDHVHGIRKP
jgi:FkbM family methyltransferase